MGILDNQYAAINDKDKQGFCSAFLKCKKGKAESILAKQTMESLTQLDASFTRMLEQDPESQIDQTAAYQALLKKMESLEQKAIITILEPPPKDLKRLIGVKKRNKKRDIHVTWLTGYISESISPDDTKKGPKEFSDQPAATLTAPHQQDNAPVTIHPPAQLLDVKEETKSPLSVPVYQQVLNRANEAINELESFDPKNHEARLREITKRANNLMSLSEYTYYTLLPELEKFKSDHPAIEFDVLKQQAYQSAEVLAKLETIPFNQALVRRDWKQQIDAAESFEQLKGCMNAIHSVYDMKIKEQQEQKNTKDQEQKDILQKRAEEPFKTEGTPLLEAANALINQLQEEADKESCRVTLAAFTDVGDLRQYVQTLTELVPQLQPPEHEDFQRAENLIDQLAGLEPQKKRDSTRETYLASLAGITNAGNMVQFIQQLENNLEAKKREVAQKNTSLIGKTMSFFSPSPSSQSTSSPSVTPQPSKRKDS
ncbi:MAG TPA: hypothetical protein VLI69_06380 [Gammaproteobacteria bacterium]|nr:hypothetical protein [Gammaproteobacteria bacterium]